MGHGNGNGTEFTALSGIMIFCKEVYRTRCNQSAVSIGNNIFTNAIMKLKLYRR
jgi:hypothetical protein